MNDLERDLHALLERKALSVTPPSAELTPTVARRVRRRQAGTGLIAGLALAAIVTVAVAGARFVSSPEPVPADRNLDGAEMQVTVASLDVTVPGTWFLMDLWYEGWERVREASSNSGQSLGKADVALLQVSNRPRAATSACGERLADDEVLVYVALDLDTREQLSPGTARTSPPTEELDGPCGRGRYADWKEHGVDYVAFVGSGPSASETDRALAATVLSSISASVSNETLRDGGATEGTGHVLDGGAGWTLELIPASPGPILSIVTPDGVGGAGDFIVPEVPIETTSFSLPDGRFIYLGAVDPRAETITLGVGAGSIGGHVIDATAPDVDLPWKPFWIVASPGSDTTPVVAVDESGAVIGREERPPPDPGSTSEITGRVADERTSTDGS